MSRLRLWLAGSLALGVLGILPGALTAMPAGASTSASQVCLEANTVVGYAAVIFTTPPTTSSLSSNVRSLYVVEATIPEVVSQLGSASLKSQFNAAGALYTKALNYERQAQSNRSSTTQALAVAQYQAGFAKIRVAIPTLAKLCGGTVTFGAGAQWAGTVNSSALAVATAAHRAVTSSDIQATQKAIPGVTLLNGIVTNLAEYRVVLAPSIVVYSCYSEPSSVGGVAQPVNCPGS